MDSATKKRLGQYFSGTRVADLLGYLCSLSASDTVLDPMSGTGDMLSAAISAGASPESVSGIEIDPDTGKRCKDRLPFCNIHIGDAFSPEAYRELGRTAWKCVITNPPYVRYQSMDIFEGDGLRLKSSKEIRQSFSDIIIELTHLNNYEKSFFLDLAKHYSGLADLAVPSWILCAALTEIDGKLAMVVPESWISRDYAIAVKYMLIKLFNIEYIIEDINSVWFPEALIKTNLLVAKRIRMRDSLEGLNELAYTHIGLGSSLIGESSLVENMKYECERGLAALAKLIADGGDFFGSGYKKRCVPMDTLYSEISSSAVFGKLLKKLNHEAYHVSFSMPKDLRDLMVTKTPSTGLVRLDAWGFNVGQGLRTGANKFFYADLLRSESDFDYLVTDNFFGASTIPVSKKYSLPVFRYQSDAGECSVINGDELTRRLILIPEDYYTTDGALCEVTDAPLETHIRNAADLRFESGGSIVRFQDLSAVRPNMKTVNGKIVRHWFMLPALARRHKPQLCISRVNYRSVKCYLIADDKTVVDANFSTLWMDVKDEQNVFAMFALLNSTWTQAYLETVSTVMGGGALKVEASHLRNLLLPAPTTMLKEGLSELGNRLAEKHFSDTYTTIADIDQLVLQAFLCNEKVDDQNIALRSYLEQKQSARTR